MALSFPNPTRSYDNKHHCVRFWGYDGTFEVSFMVDQRVFSRINPGAAQDESAILRVFDKYRDKILAVARRVYRGRHPGAYTLVAADFWAGTSCAPRLLVTEYIPSLTDFGGAAYRFGETAKLRGAQAAIRRGEPRHSERGLQRGMTDEANSSEADMMGSSDMISDDFSGAHDDAPTSPPQVPAGASKLPIEAPKVVYASTSDKKPLNPDPLQRRDQVVVAAHAGDRDFGERLLDRWTEASKLDGARLSMPRDLSTRSKVDREAKLIRKFVDGLGSRHDGMPIAAQV